MTILIAGCFQQQAEAHQAMRDLHYAGFAVDQMTTFYLNSTGQHSYYPGDAATGTVADSVVGAVIGAVVGIVTIPVLGPNATIVGVGVGAYMGSLYGELISIDETYDLPQCQSGMLVAVSAPTSEQQDIAIQIFRRHGASSIDSIDGMITAGEWIDFNPSMPMHKVVEPVLERAQINT